jgi:hypothetical protein
VAVAVVVVVVVGVGGSGGGVILYIYVVDKMITYQLRAKASSTTKWAIWSLDY